MAANPQSRDILRGWERAPKPSSGKILMDVLALALAWHERARQRRRLMQLDERALNDIGVKPDEAERECRFPFWRPFRPTALDLP